MSERMTALSHRARGSADDGTHRRREPGGWHVAGTHTSEHVNKQITLKSYAELAHAPGWAHGDMYRAIVCNLPRRLHALNAEERQY